MKGGDSLLAQWHDVTSRENPVLMSHHSRNLQKLYGKTTASMLMAAPPPQFPLGAIRWLATPSFSNGEDSF